MSKLVLIRHGKSVGNCWDGAYNNDDMNFLSLEGIEQAKQAATKVASLPFDIDFWTCSPMTRARNTTSVIMQSMGLMAQPVHSIIPEFKEKHSGLAGINLNQIEDESKEEFFIRVEDGVARILKPYLKQGNTVLVAHRYVISVIFKIFADTEIYTKKKKVPHCEPLVLTFTETPNINKLLKPV